MSFFERAKAAATDLAAKADVAMTQAGINTPGTAGGDGGDRALRDLGVLAYLEATGRPTSAVDRARIMATLHELESSGRLGPLTVSPPSGTPGAPPPPPGAAAAGAANPPPPPSHGTPPPPPPVTAPGDAGAAPSDRTAPPAQREPEATPPGSTPPPPPPSWA